MPRKAKEKPQDSIPSAYMLEYDGFGSDWISTSALGLYLTCGEAWAFKYGLRIKEPKPLKAIAGIGAHKGRQTALTIKKETEELPPRSDVLDSARDKVISEFDDNEVGEDKDFDGLSKVDKRSKLIDLSVGFASKDYDVFLPDIIPVEIEKSFAMRHREISRIIVGTVDCVDSGNYIVDEKTSSKAKGQRFADLNMGLSTYGILMLANTGKLPAGYKIHNLISRKGGQVDTEECITTRTEAQLTAQLQRFKTACEGIIKGIFIPANPDHWKCSEDYCGYWHQCRFGGKK